MKFTIYLLVHGPLAAAMSGLYTPSPSPRQDACLWPSLNSIRFRKHPAKLGTVSAMEMPHGKAGRQQTPESGMDDSRMLMIGGQPLSEPHLCLHLPIPRSPTHIFPMFSHFPVKGDGERTCCYSEFIPNANETLIISGSISRKMWRNHCVYFSHGDAARMSTAFSQAINLNVELHSLAVFLSLPFDVTSKAKIKGSECGEGKSQALSLPACDIC